MRRHQGRWHVLLLIISLLVIFIPPLWGAQPCPKYGGTIRTTDLPKSLDPAFTFPPENYRLLLYETLIHVTWDLQYEPGLAVAMPEHPTPTTYIFHLRKGVKFHDGTDFNADAVKFAFDRIMKSINVVSPRAGIWNQWIKEVSVVDPYTVKIELKKVWPDFIWYISSDMYIPSPTAVQKYGKDFGIKAAVGTGPFMLEEFIPLKRAVFVRNPHYWQPGIPCVDKVIGEWIPSGTVRLLGLKKGERNHVKTFPESQLPLIENDPNIIIEEGYASTLTILTLNTTRPPFNDKRVRQAIAYAVDGKEIIKRVYRGRGAEVKSIFPPWHWAFTEEKNTDILERNLEKAKQLLADAGYGPNNPLKFTLVTGNAPAHVERSVLLQAQFKEAGIAAEVRNVPYNQMWDDMLNGRLDMAMIQWLGGPTISDYTWDLYSGKSGKNFTGYNKPNGYQNPEVEKLLDELITIEDREQARTVIRKVQTMILEDAPAVYLNYRNHREAWRKELKGHKVTKLKNRQEFRTEWIDP
ncbi:MAG: ABC transporter substrate-binding protein [Nitrospinota bacterium]|nr:MAG: ABC transporter substrate-binding protein [Nitrospinota bacterium]